MQPFGRPLAPVILADKVSSGDGTVTLVMDDSVGDGGAAITAFWVSYTINGVAAGEKILPVAAAEAAEGSSNNRTVTVTGLTNGTEYGFTVRAESPGGVGDSSKAAVKASPAPPPAKPRIIRVSPMDGALQVLLEVGGAHDPLAADDEAATVNEQFAVKSYEIVTREIGKFSFGSPVTKEFPADALGAYILRGLTNGASYNITVVAINVVGKSPVSSPVVASPNTRWGAFKKIFAFCGGPAASSGAVVEQPPSKDGSNEGRAIRAETAAVDFGDVY